MFKRFRHINKNNYLVKYISKVEPTFGLQVKYKNGVMKYLESRIIGAPEAVAIQLSHKIVDSNMQVIFIDTNFHEDRFGILKPANQIDEVDDGDEIFQPGHREYYMSRPNVEPFITMTLPNYLTSYSVLSTNNAKITKFAAENVRIDQNENKVIKRQKVLIPRYQFLTPLDGEHFYYQQLLLKIPYFFEAELLSGENGSHTNKEECYIRSLFESHDEIDVAFKEMKIRNFDPYSISKMARKMMFEQLVDNKNTQAIIIDEVSMMSGELLEKVDEICRQTAQRSLKMKPFGGKHVILFGDLLQLPSIVKENTTHQIYESVIFENFKPFFLDQNCRQKNDVEFANMLNRIRVGAHDESDIKKLMSRVCGSGHNSEKCKDLLGLSGSMAIFQNMYRGKK
jgi:hypothetical protein